VLVHDSERSHTPVVKSLTLESQKYDSRKLKNLPDEENPLSDIDDVCFLLKHFLHAHSGFKEIELQGYLNLFAFYMNKPNDTLEKVRLIILCNLYLHKTLKYRDYFINNPRRIEQMTMKVKNKLDYGICGGAGMELKLNPKHSVMLEGRFYYGLTDVFPNHKTDIFSSSNSMTVMVTLGYFYKLK
jgi:hypothetical protein